MLWKLIRLFINILLTKKDDEGCNQGTWRERHFDLLFWLAKQSWETLQRRGWMKIFVMVIIVGWTGAPRGAQQQQCETAEPETTMLLAIGAIGAAAGAISTGFCFEVLTLFSIITQTKSDQNILPSTMDTQISINANDHCQTFHCIVKTVNFMEQLSEVDKTQCS